MRRTALLAFWPLLLGTAPLSPRLARYTIEARLDAESHEVTGHEKLVWGNPAKVPVDRLPLHLYLNAFRNDQTTWLREASGEHRGNELENFGGVRIRKLVCGGRDVRAASRLDETILWVPLQPVPPGGEVTCEIDFVSKLPRVFARTGYLEDFHLVAQWFPKPAVLGDDGRLLGHAFHVSTEFFADYGTFDVTIDVPERFVVGATGLQDEETRTSGRKRLRFLANDVHDFAWTAWPGFTELEGSVGAVRLRTLHAPAQREIARRQHDVVAAALVHFERAYGSYPYPNLTLVIPPPGAAGAGGMEYPTFITGSADAFSMEGNLGPETTAAHEFGHQYFYGLLASNEFEHAFLDEGLNTYATGGFMDQRYGPRQSALRFGALRVGQFAISRVGQGFGGVEPLATRAWEFASLRSYAMHSYMRPDLALRTLRGVVGPERMAAALRHYAARRRFTHPTPDDLLDDLSEVLGREPVDSVLRPVVFGSAWVDYAVAGIETWERRRPRGTFDSDAGPVTIDDAGPVEPTEHESEVLVTRRGNLSLPVELWTTFADGSVRRERWDGRGAHVRFAYRGPSPVVSAEVDPRRTVALDADLRNNGKAAPAPGAPRFLSRAIHWIATLLQLVGP